MCPKIEAREIESLLPVTFGFVLGNWLEDSLADAPCLFHELLVSHYVAIALEIGHADHTRN